MEGKSFGKSLDKIASAEKAYRKLLQAHHLFLNVSYHGVNILNIKLTNFIFILAPEYVNPSAPSKRVSQSQVHDQMKNQEASFQIL